MAMKTVFLIALGFWLVVQCVQAAPNYVQDVDDFENTMTVDLAKRLLNDERTLLNRLTEIENAKRRYRSCPPGTTYNPKTMTCES